MPLAQLRIDPTRHQPAYRQIVDALRLMLVSGALRAGDRLPPVRDLALDLRVHFNTVAAAYRALAAEGWLDLRRRRGVLVRPRKAPEAPPDASERVARRLRELVAEWRAAGIPPGMIARELRATAEGLKR